MPLEMAAAIADYWKGLKRDYVDKMRLGETPIGEGSGLCVCVCVYVCVC